MAGLGADGPVDGGAHATEGAGDEWICAGVRRVDRLSDHAVEKMKETMDVVQGRRLVIAEATYQHLFTADPAARHLFSLEFRSESNMQDRTARAHGNDSADDARKKSGAGEKPQMHLHGQAQVVAQMLFRFLGSLDNIRDFERHVSVIVAKHAARNIQPEQFFEWGNGFLSAIRAQLGELATPDVMDAWTEAYAYLATLMITKQQEMVEERASQRGGWKGFRPFIVKRLEAVASHGENKAVKLTLVPEDGQPTLVQKPGQYVCVRVSIPVEAGESPAVMHRNYQCAGIPTQGQYEVEVTESYSYRSQSSSNEILLRSLHEGSRLDLSVPLGGFLVGK
ncbi:Flavohemoprotein [Porphyridium purpureum]|uniref:nitric oxide dioxygenase n=1 Tax=Porphyridium purpureum TaxID=35688 RepID=A0A5J4YJH9_PORPP|nr:Flavohemoprotein [Porphyridium purpureum]|eukprot:POR1211..scf210_14